MLSEFVSRIGAFFILLGTGILILFIASEGAGAANFDYLFWAMLSVLLGFILRGRRSRPEPADRFSMLRRLRGPGRDHKERR